jgi:acyl-CoA synthetase (NDP forming)
VDAVVVAFIPPVRTPGEEVARVLAEAAAGSDTPVVACLLGMDGVVEPPARLSETTETVPSYAVPEEAVRALAAVTRYAEWRPPRPRQPRRAARHGPATPPHALVRDLLEPPRGTSGDPSRVTLDEATTRAAARPRRRRRAVAVGAGRGRRGGG